MLKEIKPDYWKDEIIRHFNRSTAISYFAILAGIVYFKGDGPSFGDFLFLLIVMVALQFLTGIVWPLAVVWLGRLHIRQLGELASDKNPSSEFLEVWWKNELVLEVFVVVLQVLLGISAYKYLGPLVGLQVNAG